MSNEVAKINKSMTKASTMIEEKRNDAKVKFDALNVMISNSWDKDTVKKNIKQLAKMEVKVRQASADITTTRIKLDTRITDYGYSILDGENLKNEHERRAFISENTSEAKAVLSDLKAVENEHIQLVKAIESTRDSFQYHENLAN